MYSKAKDYYAVPYSHHRANNLYRNGTVQTARRKESERELGGKQSKRCKTSCSTSTLSQRRNASNSSWNRKNKVRKDQNGKRRIFTLRRVTAEKYNVSTTTPPSPAVVESEDILRSKSVISAK